MDFKCNPLSFLCASLIFICAAFTTNSPSNFSKKDKKKTLTTIPTSSNTYSFSSLNCFQTPLDFLPTLNFLALNDTLNQTILKQEEQTTILALLDEEATQKTNKNDIKLDKEKINTIDFSTPNHLAISPQLLEKIAIREDFVNSLVDIAVAQEGVPYVYGGKSPRGFDCSGFVSYVYAQFKINLPASSRSYDQVGKRVKLADVQIGDILCFTGRNSHSGRTGHVGIVVENNPNEPIKFIHAASGSRRRITYSTMESSYYKPRFRSARRISVPVLEEVLETQDTE